MRHKILSIFVLFSLFTSSAIKAEGDSALSVGGALIVDQIFPMFDTGDATEGAFLAGAELDVMYSFSDSVYIALNIGLSASGTAGIGPAFLGVNDLFPGLNLQVGQIGLPAALETADMSGNFPFFSTSLASLAFQLPMGPGVYLTYSGEHWSIQAAARQPKFAESYSVTDPWGASTRLSVAPVLGDDLTIPFGLSFSFQDINNSDNLPKISAAEASGRSLRDLSVTLQANNRMTGIVDFSPQYKSFLFSSEFYMTQVSLRETDEAGKDAYWLYGGSASLDWILTGESRSYDVESGTYGDISAADNESLGIWDLGVRYSYLNLSTGDDKRIEQNITGSLSWYPLDAIRVGAEYVYAMYQEAEDTNLGVFRLRLQAVF